MTWPNYLKLRALAFSFGKSLLIELALRGIAALIFAALRRL